MGKLSQLARAKVLKRSDYAIPETRSYAMPDEASARMCLKRVDKFGTAAEKKMVREAIKRKYPDMGVE